MNIAEILKDCPKGTKLYSTIYGEVRLLSVNDNNKYPITIEIDNDGAESFTSDGKLYFDYNGECTLFPSKDNRDWSTFKVLNKECKFKPFDKVLVRAENTNKWYIDLFSHIDNSVEEFKYKCMVSSWNQCIPYEGNEHLLGTSNNPD